MSVCCSQPTDPAITRTRSIPGFRLTEFTQPPMHRLPWHAHADASVCYVAAGTYKERMRGVDEVCSMATLVFKPAGERHADQFGPDGGRCLLIEVAPARLASIERYGSIMRQPGIRQGGMLSGLGRRIHREFLRADAVSPLALEGLILEAIAEASRAPVPGLGRRQPPWLARARELIHDTPGQSHSLTGIAAQVGVHPAHLARSFRLHLHCSLGSYVRAVRLERAAWLLAESDVPLAEMAHQLGFFDQSHFTRTFRLHTGFTPAAFRKAARSAGTTVHRTC